MLTDMSVAAGFLVVVVYPDVSDHIASRILLPVIDTLDMRTASLHKFRAISFRTGLPFVANNWTSSPSERSLSLEVAELCTCTLVDRALDTGTPFTPVSHDAVDWARY